MASTEHLRELLQRVGVRQQQYERALAEAMGVDRLALEALYQLMVSGPRTPGEVARVLRASSAATTLVLNRLERAGHVHRAKHPSDGRKVVVAVDARTQATAQELVDPLIRDLDHLLSQYRAEDRDVLADFLTAAAEIYATRRPSAEEPLHGPSTVGAREQVVIDSDDTPARGGPRRTS